MKELDEVRKDSEAKELLWILREGRAYTLIELANVLKLPRSSVKELLHFLIQRQWIITIGRRTRKYYCLKDASVSKEVMEWGNDKLQKISIDNKLGIKYCRTCYDHLAGNIGVQLTEQLFIKGFLARNKQKVILTNKGMEFFNTLGIIKELEGIASDDTGSCLDFSERKYHLGAN